MIQKEKTMIQKSEAKELEALIYGVLEKFFSNPASGATSSRNSILHNIVQVPNPSALRH